MVPEKTDSLTRKMSIYWDCKIHHTFYTFPLEREKNLTNGHSQTNMAGLTGNGGFSQTLSHIAV